ncbi:PREDICTED: E3 ubiquitin-protein ligase TRIM36 [Thamnophis sirtalis]|uniref:E3 ubiquitin-protein ligase TRIM36 n=1 Tax=Thamnophis sirtalis TaxID=35019 RepID=A0A6I9XP18_9SAUR|nr:PREDICTED: E3 ubiquitin-protein ligase TRIM36 [Thamnophis sirtalis]
MEGDRLEPVVTIKNIERELICPACKELFTHPLILPCQHSICHKCVKEILYLTFEDSFNDAASETSNHSSPRSRMNSPSLDRIDRVNRSGWKRNSLTPRTTTFPCPGCRHDVDLGERGISGLFRNVTLETIVERYRQAARAATAIMCDLCKPPAQESTKSCMDCGASYCNECFKIHHPWGTLKAQHEYVGPTTNFRPKVSVNMLSCFNLKKKQCNGERAKEEASNNFDKLFHVLEEKKNTAIRAIETSKHLRMDKLHSQIEEYQGLLENNGLVGYAQEVLKETDPSCFVQTAKQLHDRIQKATESLKSFRPAAQASFEDFVLDIEKQQEALENMCFHSNENVNIQPYEYYRISILMCPEHEMEKVNMYCEICRRPVCHLCKLGGTHANHRVTTMSSAYKTLKEKLSQDIHYLISKESHVKNQITELGLLVKEAEYSFFRYEQDSGHDSGSEDIFAESLQPFTLITIGMKKMFIPKASSASAAPKDCVNRVLPMPSNIGICLDCDKGSIGFYDADRMKCIYERPVECSGKMYPAFALMGSSGIHLEETIAAKYLQYQDEDI